MVEFIGMIRTSDASEIRPVRGPFLDRDYTRRFAQAHEEASFDRVLIGYHSWDADGFAVAGYAAAHTERLGFLIAHRPGFVAPTVWARKIATLDQFTGGRIAVHIISGASDTEQRRDGDHTDKTTRYRRTDEYLDVVRRTWAATEPFSFEGEFYRVEGALSRVPTFTRPRVPIYFGGSSADAYRVGGRHADVYALWGEPLRETAEQIASVRAAATAAGRDPAEVGISVSFRPILGRTDEEAWERARSILRVIEGGTVSPAGNGSAPYVLNRESSVGSRRLLAAADRGEVHDRALWTATAKATGAAGNSTALVGSPETVARALLDYVDIGVTTILIRGYEPLEDAVAYGRDLLPLVRSELAHRAAAAV
ncbi:LLM class flavin-dependent oxidoreductase [Marinitenerispora sediminis]|uniref:Alkanesulfonate monooxygenase n=1 Tax=Marinitenerispora sediminis TaxID=1931232 RepID=A0A368SZK2_9ACTN|nr:LLM class flavin-dependent oxidoreductase [Marinitenerispora sediminis]RCV50829.1 alkanesulfonate monooxygenase [Marinitenerispora sediminis]RCV51388.1 alkanesulfonate monooxygenase [Marinitenerispora sediminis]RCV58113.1 alkanesulfonate monooxygenase [Marinitenerispora sediminis]